jgi:protein-tyrosine phosphatase
MGHSYFCNRCVVRFCGFIIIVIAVVFSAQDTVKIDLRIPADSSTTPDTRPTSNPFDTHTVDKSIPLPTNFAWRSQGNSKPLLYDVFISEDSVLDAADIFAQGLNDSALSVWNLKINTSYRWKVVAKDTVKGGSWSSTVFSFKTPNLWPRLIWVDGTTNVRDIGGRPNKDDSMIRQGIFYRSAEYNQSYPVTPKGLSQLSKLGIVCEIDLRNSGENPQIVMPWLSNYIRPKLDNGDGMYTYLNGLQNAQPVVRTCFKEMADKQNYPMIIHCRIGADRTGTIVAVLEALLGCTEQQMGQNYIWTSVSTVGSRDTATSDWREIIAYLKSFDNRNGTVQAGAWYYLQKIGVSAAELVSIRKIFLNDDRLPYPPLAVLGRYDIRPSLKRHAARQYFLSSGQHSLLMQKGVRRLTLYDLSGKRIWEYVRANTENSEIIKMPVFASNECALLLLR